MDAWSLRRLDSCFRIFTPLSQGNHDNSMGSWTRFIHVRGCDASVRGSLIDPFNDIPFGCYEYRFQAFRCLFVMMWREEEERKETRLQILLRIKDNHSIWHTLSSSFRQVFDWKTYHRILLLGVLSLVVLSSAFRPLDSVDPWLLRCKSQPCGTWLQTLNPGMRIFSDWSSRTDLHRSVERFLKWDVSKKWGMREIHTHMEIAWERMGYRETCELFIRSLSVICMKCMKVAEEFPGVKRAEQASDTVKKRRAFDARDKILLSSDLSSTWLHVTTYPYSLRIRWWSTIYRILSVRTQRLHSCNHRMHFSTDPCPGHCTLFPVEKIAWFS